MIYLIGGASVVALVILFALRHILGGMFGLYRIIPPNEAHIRILANKKDIFCYLLANLSKIFKEMKEVIPVIFRRFWDVIEH